MSIDKALVKQLARGQWRMIYQRLGVNVPPSPSKHAFCPNCGGKDRFRLDDKGGDGSHICSQCGAGDGFYLLMKVFGWTFPQALEAVYELLNNPVTVNTSPSSTQSGKELYSKRRRNIDELLKNSVATGDPLVRYLISRGLEGIVEDIPPALRYHDNFPYWEEVTKGRWKQLALCPAMVSQVTDLAGNLISIHRTFLTQEGNKAPYASPKKLMPTVKAGSLKGSSVKLAQPSDELCLTEGIETALAVWLNTGIPTWACLNAHLLESVEVPEEVTKIHIMADKDTSRTGERSATKLARRLVVQGYEVRVCFPAGEIPSGQKSVDWLDVFNRNKEVAA